MVFVEEQAVPVELELDERDPAADHLLARQDGRGVGTARLVIEEPGFEGADPAYGPVAHLGRIAVLAEARHAGSGRASSGGWRSWRFDAGCGSPTSGPRSTPSPSTKDSDTPRTATSSTMLGSITGT